MALEYVKVNRLKWVVKNTSDVIIYINKVMNDISNNTVDDFDTNINTMLFDSLLSRYVSSDFLTKYPDATEELNFINLDVSLPDRVVTLSVGKVNISDNVNKKFNGVLYA